MHPLGGFIQLDDAYLGGERSGGKRGRGAPGKTPFVAAVETNAEGHPLRVKLTVVEGFRLTEIAAWAQQHLSPGTQVLSDGLACFNGVTAAGCVHEPMVTGGGKAAVERPEFRWVNTILGNIKNALCGTYHAVLFAPSMRSDIWRSSSTGSIGASTCPTSSPDWSTWRCEPRRCRNGCSSYAWLEW